MTKQVQIARLIHRVEARALLNVLSQCGTSTDGSLILPRELARELQRFASSSFEKLSEDDRGAAMLAAATVIALVEEAP